MTEATLHRALVWAVFALAALTFASLLRFRAPYGRHYAGSGWGPAIPNRLGWIVMEVPATVLFACVYATGEAAAETVPLILLAMWQGHPTTPPGSAIPDSSQAPGSSSADSP